MLFSCNVFSRTEVSRVRVRRPTACTRLQIFSYFKRGLFSVIGWTFFPSVYLMVFLLNYLCCLLIYMYIICSLSDQAEDFTAILCGKCCWFNEALKSEKKDLLRSTTSKKVHTLSPFTSENSKILRMHDMRFNSWFVLCYCLNLFLPFISFCLVVCVVYWFICKWHSPVSLIEPETRCHCIWEVLLASMRQSNQEERKNRKRERSGFPQLIRSGTGGSDNTNDDSLSTDLCRWPSMHNTRALEPSHLSGMKL